MHPKNTDLIIELYASMPGAPSPSRDDDGYAVWGEVEGNAHWQFCEAIVDMVERQIGYAVSTLASSHNLATF